MCGGVIESIGEAVGGAFESVGDVVDDALVGLDKTVGEVPGGWLTAGGLAAGGAFGLGALGGTALEAGAVAAADATAAGMGWSSAAEAIAAGAISAEGLGLPAATTLAELGAVSNSASAGYLGLGIGPGVAGGVPFGEAAGLGDIFAGGTSTGTGLTYGGSGIGLTGAGGSGIGIVAPATATGLTDAAGAAIMAPGATTAAGTLAGGAAGTTSLGTILGYAKTAAPIIGGLGKLAGGIMGIQTGNQMKQYGAAADPNSPYRSGYASQLYNLINDPNTVTQTPGYQFNLAQGLNALQAQQAAQGRLVSGGALIQSQQFGQNLASQTYNQQVDTLARLSGAYQAPATGATAQGALAASALGSTYGGWNSIASGVGTAGTGLLNLYDNYNNPSPNPVRV